MKTPSLPKRRVGRPTKEESQRRKELVSMRNINRPSLHPSSSPDVIMQDESRSSNTDTFYPISSLSESSNFFFKTKIEHFKVFKYQKFFNFPLFNKKIVHKPMVSLILNYS